MLVTIGTKRVKRTESVTSFYLIILNLTKTKLKRIQNVSFFLTLNLSHGSSRQIQKYKEQLKMYGTIYSTFNHLGVTSILRILDIYSCNLGTIKLITKR